MSYYGQRRAYMNAKKHPVRNACFILIVGIVLMLVSFELIRMDGFGGAEGIFIFFLMLYGIYCILCAIKQFITKRKVNGIADFFSSPWKG